MTNLDLDYYLDHILSKTYLSAKDHDHDIGLHFKLYNDHNPGRSQSTKIL